MTTQAFFYINGEPCNGKWIELDSIDSYDEVKDELIESGLIAEDYDGEILVADSEGLAKSFTGTYGSFDFEGFVDCRDNDGDEDAKIAYIDCIGDWNGDNFDESYSGEFDSAENFAQDMAEQIGAIDQNAGWPNNCIDWEYAARELMYDYSESNGHYFRNI